MVPQRQTLLHTDYHSHRLTGSAWKAHTSVYSQTRFVGITKTTYFNTINSTLTTFVFVLSWILPSGTVSLANVARITVRVAHVPPSRAAGGSAGRQTDPSLSSLPDSALAPALARKLLEKAKTGAKSWAQQYKSKHRRGEVVFPVSGSGVWLELRAE